MMGVGRVGRLGCAGKKRAVAAYSSAQSLQFTGTSSQYCSRADAAGHEFTTAMSMSLWVKGANTADYAGVVTKHDYGNTQNGYAVLRSGGVAGKPRVIIYDTGGNTKQYDSSLTAFDNTWHHVCFTFGSSTLKIYVDGVLDSSPTLVADQAVTTLKNNTCGLRFASQLSAGSPANYYTGYLDEVSLWSVELSAAEVLALYNSGNPPDVSLHSQYANCASWYKCGDGDTIAANGIVDTKGSLHLSPTNSPTIASDAP